jgi:hypothetical protein
MKEFMMIFIGADYTDLCFRQKNYKTLWESGSHGKQNGKFSR